MSNSDPGKGQGSFVMLARELRQRLREPAAHVSFWTFFLLGIVGFSAMGFWFELLRARLGSSGGGNEAILNAIYTYFPAVSGAAAFQMIIAEEQRFLRSFATLTLTVIFVVFVILFLGLAGTGAWAFIISALATIGSWFIWWIANANERGFLDVQPSAALGGSTSGEPSGSTEGFHV